MTKHEKQTSVAFNDELQMLYRIYFRSKLYNELNKNEQNKSQFRKYSKHNCFFELYINILIYNSDIYNYKTLDITLYYCPPPSHLSLLAVIY